MPIKKSFFREAVDEAKAPSKTEARKPVVFPAKMKVRDIMREASTVLQDASIRELLQKLKEQEETCFIVQNTEGEMSGLVTESDLMKMISKPTTYMGVGGMGYRSLFFRSAETVKDIMARNVISISPDAKLEEAARIMLSNKIRHLPVVKDKKCIGMLSIRNILMILRILM